MITFSHWKPVHVFLVKNRKFILNAFLAAYLFCFFFILAGFYLFSNEPEAFWFFYDFAGTIGSLSLILFLITLLPGIMSRFKVFPLVTASLVLFRRQIGILMFFSGMVHSFYISTIPALMTNTFVPGSLPLKSMYGVIGLTILMPVWLTSNDYSQKKFGPFWKTIQRLTYFAVLAIFAHVALNSSLLAIPTAIIILLEVASWIKVWISKKNN